MARPTCNQCLRPVSRCWCHLVQPIDTSIKLWVIQHRLEVGHPKNTGLLLSRCCDSAQLIDGSSIELGTSQPIPQQLGHSPALLFPDAPTNANSKANSHLSNQLITDLIVLDANWRKAKAWVLSSTWLQSLPRISLDSPSQAPNEVRSSTVTDARSTFVAAIEALDQLGHLESPLDDALAIYRDWQQIIINDQPPRQ